MCNIEFDNKILYAGEKLTGRIIYNLTNPEIIYGVRVKICGKAYWGKKNIILSRNASNRLSVTKTKNLNAFKNIKGNIFKYQPEHQFEDIDKRHSNGESEILRGQKNIIFLYEEKIFLENDFYVYGNGNDTVNLLPGTHNFQFAYRIPSLCPSSFKCENHISCSIEYTITVERIIESMPFEDAKGEFFILKYIDLNNYPQALAPAKIEFERKIFIPICCYPKLFDFRANLPKKGIIPGTEIEIEGKCKNESCISIKTIRICLHLHLIVYSECEKQRIIWKRDILLSKKCFGGMNSKRTSELTFKFPIPPIQPWNTDNSGLFQINYTLEFKVKFQNFYRPLVEKIPIIFGNGPKLDDIGKSSEEILNAVRNQLIVLNDLDDADENTFAKAQREIHNK